MEENNSNISSTFKHANNRIKKMAEDLKTAKLDSEKEAIELFALLELNIDFFKHKLSGEENEQKQEMLFKFLDRNTSFNISTLKQNREIISYLNKNGILERDLFFAIDWIVHILFAIVIVSILFLIAPFGFSYSPFILLVIVVAFMLSVFLDLVSNVNFYTINEDKSSFKN